MMTMCDAAPLLRQALASPMVADVHCRWVLTTPADELALREIYASTRTAEMHAWGLDPASRQAFIDLQWRAQRLHRQRQWPDALQWIIERQGEALGTLCLHAQGGDLHLLDIAVLPVHRGQGIATACMAKVLDLVDRQGWRMHLHVLNDNPIARWYVRLGFAFTEDTGHQGYGGPYRAMTRAPVLEKRYEQA